MTREGYAIARAVVHLAAATAALILAWVYWRRRPQLSGLAKLTLSLAAFACLESAVFPFWLLFVSTLVPIRDEGLAVAVWHLFVIGPAALGAATLSAFQEEVRKVGIGLCLGFVVLSPLAAVLDLFL